MNQYDLVTITSKVLEKFRSSFKQELKTEYEIDFEIILKKTLQDLGLPIHFPAKNTIKVWFDKIYHLSYLEEYIKSDKLQEIIIHSNKNIQIDSIDRQINTLDSLTEDELQYSLEVLAQRNNKEWNNSTPFISFQTKIFGELFRISLCHFSTSAENRSKAFLRKIQKTSFKINDFCHPSINEYIANSVKIKKNIMICGATGSGKTSLLRAMLNQISREEHIITIEDTYELKLENKLQTSFISKRSKQNSMKEYCKYAMRMKPDRLLVGEIRGEEIVPFLLSGNSGHKGMMSSIHANSAYDCISRLALLFQIYSDQKGLSYENVIQLICGSIDEIIYVKNRKITEIIKILGCEGTNPYFEKIFDTMQ